MPAAPRFESQSEDDLEPETPMEPDAAPHHAGPKKSKKNKKDKAEKQKRKKHTLAETELLDLELEPPKAKKIKKKKEMAVKNEDGISECNSISHMSNGVKHSKKEKNSCEDSHIECGSDQDEELTAEQKEGAFSNFDISKATLDLLKARGVTHLFPVQVKTFKPVFEGKDVIAQARTGTGKTFSFAIPLIEKLDRDPQERKRGRSPKVIKSQ
ncbi:nucleolar RNA helicase 2-like [Thamnophis elegans]|uniref:nucleolar RNA helicase 2-like n=1 Tax=Thamnophis elegans TaxID=35005 RepID=UPI001378AF1E|nr:nucleolar RNA helicase 2-like [Thamnophis elegans]